MSFSLKLNVAFITNIDIKLQLNIFPLGHNSIDHFVYFNHPGIFRVLQVPILPLLAAHDVYIKLTRFFSYGEDRIHLVLQ